jgi:hypothetical protein
MGGLRKSSVWAVGGLKARDYKPVSAAAYDEAPEDIIVIT